VLPHVTYQDVDEAIAWLGKTFGFCEHYRYGDATSGARGQRDPGETYWNLAP